MCSACGPPEYGDGDTTKYGVWHNKFPRTYLPLGMFKTNRVGNLEHIETGDEGYKQYAIAAHKEKIVSDTVEVRIDWAAREITDALNNGTVFVRLNSDGTREIIPYHDVIAVPDELGDTYE